MPGNENMNSNTSLAHTPFSEKLKWDTDLRWESCVQSEENKNTKTSKPHATANIIQDAIKNLPNSGSGLDPSVLHKAAVYPTDGELGELASLVYQEDGGDKLLKALDQNNDQEALSKFKSLNLKGWKLIGMASNGDGTNGYFGALYWQPEKGHFVLAHRGTHPTNLGALWTDVKGISAGYYVKQMNSAATFSHIVVEALRKWSITNGDMPILSFTGHSLGGWLSQVTTFTTRYLERSESHFKKRATFLDYPHTVVWDSPGCKPMLLQLKRDFDLRYNAKRETAKLSLNALDIKSYLSAPNQINTCNMHVGVIYRLFPKLTIGKKPFDLFSYTLKTHSLAKLLAVYPQGTENKDEELKKVIDWPIRSGITGGKEYKKFFKVMKKLNNHAINDIKQLPSIDTSTVKQFNIRYRTESVDSSKVDMRIFSDKERKFLESMKALQGWLDREKGNFSSLKGLNEFLNNKLSDNIETIKKAFNAYTLENNASLLQAREADTSVESVIFGIKQLVRHYPEIVDIAEQEIQNIPRFYEAVYRGESNRFIRELDEEVTLRLNKDQECLRLVPFLENEKNKVLHINTNTPAEAMMVSQIGVDLLAKTNESLKDYSGEQGVSFLSISMIRSNPDDFQKFYESSETPKLLWIDGSSGLKAKDEEWLDLLGTSGELLLTSGKKVVLLTKKSDPIFEKIEPKLFPANPANPDNPDNYYLSIEPKKLTWTELTDGAQQHVLEEEVHFQGTTTPLKELVKNDPGDIIDNEFLKKLLNRETVTIGSQPLGTSDLEGAYAELFEKVNKEALETNLSNSPPEVIYVISGIPIQGKEEEVKNSLMNNLGHEQDNDNLKNKINILTPPYFLPSTDKNIQLVDNAFQEVHFKDLCNKHVDKKIHWIRWHDNASKFELQKIYNPGFYIDRGFNKEVVFESNKIGEILTGGKIGTFVFSGDIFGDDEKHNYKQLSTLLETKDPSSEDGFKTLTDNSDTLLVIKDQHAARKKFNELKGTVHWLEVKGDDNNNKQIIWRNSKGCVKPDLDNVNYVSMDTLRKCVDTDGPKNDLCKENDLLKAIEDKQAVIIADDPGMGKSTSLIKLCQQLYKQKPGTVESPESPWIINVSLKNCLQEVRSIKKPDEDINMADIVGFLSKVGKNLDGKFAQKLLTSALDPNSTEKFPKPLLVTFDGFDEVLDQEGRDKIIELLKALKDKTRAKFWVTTRLQHKKSLENALSTFAVTFKPLDVDAQKLFIKKFFQDRLSLLLPGDQMPNEERMNKYTAAFIEKMQSMFQGNVSSFIGTPLQLALLLESKGSIEACKKWAEEDNAVPDFAYLGNNILEVYENFIQGKYETYFKKIGVKQGEVHQATKDFCNSLHRNLAGALVSSSGSDKKVRRHKDMALSVGLIKPEDNKLCFIHPTFGEYFASRTYMDWIEKEPVFPNTNKHKHLLY